MTGIIIYKGKYGATAQYAQWLSEELNIYTCEANRENDQVLRHCNYVILGTSVYIGKLQLAKWLKRHAEILAQKKVFLYVVCATPSTEVRKLHDIVAANVPHELSDHLTVFFLRGRMIKSDLSALDRLMLKAGASMVKDPVEKKTMLTDFDDVKKENLADLLASVKNYTSITASSRAAASV